MVPSSDVTLALTPGGSVEIHAGPETLALPQAQARLYGTDGRPYRTSIFSTDGLISTGGVETARHQQRSVEQRAGQAFGGEHTRSK